MLQLYLSVDRIISCSVRTENRSLHLLRQVDSGAARDRLVRWAEQYRRIGKSEDQSTSSQRHRKYRNGVMSRATI